MNRHRIWKGVPDVNHGLMQMAETTGGYGQERYPSGYVLFPDRLVPFGLCQRV